MAVWTGINKNSASWTGINKTLINSFLLLETNDYMLLETGDKIILEQSTPTGQSWTNISKN